MFRFRLSISWLIELVLSGHIGETEASRLCDPELDARSSDDVRIVKFQ